MESKTYFEWGNGQICYHATTDKLLSHNQESFRLILAARVGGQTLNGVAGAATDTLPNSWSPLWRWFREQMSV
jgi:hypothetical protein